MFELFKKCTSKPDAATVAAKDLEEAKRQLLKAQSAAEFYSSQVKYFDGVVRRLTTYVEGTK